MGFGLTRFNCKIDEEFICTICSEVFENPVQSTCEHIFCNQCIIKWLAIIKTCPVCRNTVKNVTSVARYFRNLIDKLEIKCDYELEGCPSILKLEHLKDHITNHCKYNPNTEIICDKGCNITISRHEYNASNCFSHLSNAIKKLNDKQDEQSKILNSLRWQICSKMDISVDDPNILEYGRRNIAGDLGLVQSFRPLAPGNTSFKIEILDGGVDNIITIGLTPKGYSIESQPGWKDGSIGYHGDDGNIFYESGKIEEFGPKWQNGDIIECGVKFPSNFTNNSNIVEVFFSINEQLVGERLIKMPQFGFFPTFAIRSKGGKVRYFVE